MDEYALMIYYSKYLRDIRKVSESTIKHYQEALKYISKYLVSKKKLQKSLYEIRDIEELEYIRNYLYSSSDFIALDQRGHRMYSAGFNNYYRFACGKEFSSIHDNLHIMDTEMFPTEVQIRATKLRKRSSIIKIQCIEAAGYKCEVNSEHITFIAKSTGKPYMEGHHALPMKLQDRFDRSLDVYGNIVCLCPLCHRLLHYGIPIERERVLNKIYSDRSERLAVSGIKISRAEFVNIGKSL